MQEARNPKLYLTLHGKKLKIHKLGFASVIRTAVRNEWNAAHERGFYLVFLRSSDVFVMLPVLPRHGLTSFQSALRGMCVHRGLRIHATRERYVIIRKLKRRKQR